MWILLALFSGAFASILAIMVKLHLKSMNAFFITFLFSLITLFILVVVDLFTSKVNCKLMTTLTYKEWALVIAAACLNGLAFISYMSALKCGRTGGVVAIDRLGILYVILLSAIFLKETFSLKTIVGAVAMIVGAILISTK